MTNAEVINRIKSIYDVCKDSVAGEIITSITYHSCKLEGSQLTKSQVSEIWEKGVILNSKYNRNDLIEAKGHIVASIAMMNSLDIDLSEAYILNIHQSVMMFTDIEGGLYKARENCIGDIETVKPADVTKAMNNLLEWYNKADKNLSNLMKFHARFEQIHPFEDGNGRVGRLILFKECIKWGIPPFIIRYEDRKVYHEFLKRANKRSNAPLTEWEKRLYIDTVKKEQESFKRMIERVNKYD